MRRHFSAMNRFLQIFLPTVLATSFAACIRAEASANTQDKGIYLYQTSGILGDLDVTISPIGIKIVAAKTGTVTISSPPEWKIVTYNPRTKSSFTSSIKTFSGYLPPETFRVTGLPWSKLPMVRTKSEQIAGLPADSYVTPQSFTDKQLKDQNNDCADSAFIKSAKFITAKNITAPAHASALLSQFHCVPNKGSLPLKFQYIDLRGNLNTMLVTSQCKPVTVSKSDFEIPSDLKPAASIYAVQTSANKTTVRKKRPLL